MLRKPYDCKLIKSFYIMQVFCKKKSKKCIFFTKQKKGVRFIS